ncbi:MAG: FAD-dependent oxidoreductase [Candidatus Aminicenantes bacterium]|nr:FAD-dependent oxidoreductase [Candidatus Aminicenantes bacterium]
MKAVIVGNGLAGTITAKTLREADAEIEIVVFGEERYLYYPRPNLIEYLAGRLPLGKLFAYPQAWYAGQRIDVRLSTRVRRVLPDERRIERADGGSEGYGVLCLADGASSSVPPIRGADKPGVLTLRTLDDAEAILARVASRPEVVVIGGGLLGLEIARALKARGASVTVLEFFPNLLPRQLDPPGAAVLTRQIEAGGIKVRVGVVTEEIIGGSEAAGVRLKTGEEIPAGTVLIAAGVRPNTALAREAGLTVDRGVVVDDDMATSRPGIFAAGDGTQHKGRLYGIIPASFDQARTAAASMLGHRRPYAGTVPSNTLKVMGLHLASVGVVNPERPGEIEELRREDAASGLYRKIVLEGGRLVGAVWMGTREGVPLIAKAVAERRDVAAFKNEILADGFDYARLASEPQ